MSAASDGRFELKCPACRMTVRGTIYAAAFEARQPDEPTGLGAVVEVEGMRFTRHDDGNWWQGAHGWKWAIVLDRGPVTILSTGLES